MEAAPLGPVSREERIAALDVARGAAVLGVLLMNIWAFAGPQAFFDYPLAIADRAGAPVATWAVMHTLFEGSQRTLLSLLFGAGAVLALARFERTGPPKAARATYYRRSFGLVALGLVNAYLFMWPADILFCYGLASLCLYPLRRLPTPALVAIAVAALAVPFGLHSLEVGKLRALEPAAAAAEAKRDRGEALDAAEEKSIADWAAKLAKARPDPADEEMAAEIRTMQSGSLAEVAARQAGVSVILETVVTIKWWFLDALAMMIIGMVLCRSGLMAGQAPASRYLLLAAAGFAVGLPLAAWQTQSLLASDFHPLTAEIAKLGYDLRRLGMALGWLGLLFALARWRSALTAGLAAVGRMALTNYLAQSILCAFLFYGFGLGLYGRLTGYELYAVVLAIWALEFAWSGWWLARFQVGPFEWLWRSWTYRRAQSWRRATPAAQPAVTS